jgi:acyl-CoA synthetase (AMP-forming)/AMP-acid ligase II
MEVNIGYLLERSATKFPDKPAIIFEEKRIPFKTLNQRAYQVAHALLAIGIKKGDKVAVLLENSPELLECLFGITRMGAVCAILNSRLRPAELTYIINHSDSKLLIYGIQFLEEVNKLRKEIKIEKYICLDSESNPSESPDWNYERLVNQYSGDYQTIKVSEGDAASIMYTSGVTGRPKGVIQPHRFWVWMALNFILGYKTDPADIVLTSTPIFHIAAFARCVAAVYVGISNVLMRRFEPRKFLELIEREKVTLTMLVPTMFAMVKQLPDHKKYDLSSLRYFVSGAAPASVEMLKQVRGVFPNVEIRNSYGSTEVGAVTMLEPQDFVRKIGTVGKPFLNSEVCLLDEEGGAVKTGDIGEICARGPESLIEYYKDPEATKQVFWGDWVRTGDLGKFDEEGFLYIVDRKKDMIISGGENVYSLEIENVLATHEKILEAAIIGVPDELWGETVRAIVVPKPGETLTEKEVIDFCAAKLAGYKKPKSVIFIDGLPKTDSNKILKRTLREQYGKPR